MRAGVGQRYCVTRRDRHRGRVLLCVGLLLAAAGARRVFAKSGSETEPVVPIKVLMYNYARVSSQNLAAAERQANKILAGASVQAIWVDCLKDNPIESGLLCPNASNPHTPVLRVLPGHVTNQFADSEFGFAQIPVYATISYEHIVRRAERDNEPLEIPILLGTVIAHELGHLLLGDPRHSALGIMQPRWGSDQIHQAWCGRLLFTAEQADLIRAKVRAFIQTDSAASPAARGTPSTGSVAVPDLSSGTYTVFNAAAEQEEALRAQIRFMHPDVLPLRVVFVPHWKYLAATRDFHLHVPIGYNSLMFTHLPSRTVFIDNDRYLGEAWLGHWIAHELGHLATNSTEEEDAERVTSDYRKRLKDAHRPDVH